MATISIRQQIKNKLVEILTGLTVNSKNINVFLNDPYALEEDDLPAICIQTVNNTIIHNTVGYPRTQERILNIDITCIYQATNDLDDIIEEFTTVVETALNQDEDSIILNSSGNIITQTKIDNIDFRDFSEIATKTAGTIISFVVEYICVENELKADI